ncbi:hypothetical protein [Tenacibaculum geojense]|uniref:DUF3649 domain-containing protein n=1 Tax=Tenacibaculum geojense TaxID=915352 RepID=A0ABW3JR65_9FLAO
MPANKKYLSNNWQRFAKVTAGFFGGYIVTMTFHMALAYIFPHKNVIITSSFTSIILWVALIITAFIAKNGWKIWALYTVLSILFSVLIYLGNTYTPLN